MSIMLTLITHTGYHHLPVKLSQALLLRSCMTQWIHCLACEVPNRYMVHCHKFYPELLSQVDVSCDVLGESASLLETASDVSECMCHEISITADSGYHSPHQTVPVHLDRSSGSWFQVLLIKFLAHSQKGMNMP